MNNFIEVSRELKIGRGFYIGPFVLIFMVVVIMSLFTGVHGFANKFMGFMIWSIICMFLSWAFFRSSSDLVIRCSDSTFRFWLIWGGVLWCLMIEIASIGTSFIALGGMKKWGIIFDILSASKSTLLLYTIFLFPIHFIYSLYLRKRSIILRSA